MVSYLCLPVPQRNTRTPKYTLPWQALARLRWFKFISSHFNRKHSTLSHLLSPASDILIWAQDAFVYVCIKPCWTEHINLCFTIYVNTMLSLHMHTILFIHIPKVFKYKVYCWGNTFKKITNFLDEWRDREMDNLIRGNCAIQRVDTWVSFQLGHCSSYRYFWILDPFHHQVFQFIYTT